MGLAITMLGALTLMAGAGLPSEVASTGVRFLELDPEVLAITRRETVELELPTRPGSPEAPLEVLVTGIASGLPPVELARERFTGTDTARARVLRGELDRWDQLVVTWTQPGVTGTPAARVAGRLVRAAGAPEGWLPSLALEPEPKIDGSFVIYTCPAKKSAAGKGGCTVTYAYVNPASGKVTEGTIELDPGESVTLSAFLVLWSSCSGCV